MDDYTMSLERALSEEKRRNEELRQRIARLEAELRAVKPTPITAEKPLDIQVAVCNYFGVTLQEMFSPARHQAIVFPRAIAMYLCRHRLGMSYPAMGEAFGGRDHTTVIAAIRKVDQMIRSNNQFTVRAIDQLEEKLNSDRDQASADSSDAV
jgi:chromosomal replication initiator protein